MRDMEGYAPISLAMVYSHKYGMYTELFKAGVASYNGALDCQILLKASFPRDGLKHPMI